MVEYEAENGGFDTSSHLSARSSATENKSLNHRVENEHHYLNQIITRSNLTILLFRD